MGTERKKIENHLTIYYIRVAELNSLVFKKAVYPGKMRRENNSRTASAVYLPRREERMGKEKEPGTPVQTGNQEAGSGKQCALPYTTQDIRKSGERPFEFWIVDKIF